MGNKMVLPSYTILTLFILLMIYRVIKKKIPIETGRKEIDTYMGLVSEIW